ncbi:MAG TPA: hypothetical protein VFV38_48175 [Ktedonobacteraceae bacterium]|nr:hypothetical protein [Ktedonobacteraceae bacterium]
MGEMLRKVTLWLAWYRDQAEPGASGRPLRLRMLHAASREEARLEMLRWLEQKKLLAEDLERLEPSPYGLTFQAK